MKTFISFLLCFIAFGCHNSVEPDNPEPANSNIPANIPFQVVKEYPHDTAAFTEGLQFVNGKLYESTGNYEKSDIRIVDLATGKKELSKPLEDKYFGEGLTVLNSKAYQLTYQENTAFVYDSKTLKQLNSFTYNFGQGWGMTTDGKSLIVSTGSSNLYFVDPANFKVIKSVGVSDQYGPVPAINELEYIKGYVYANRWQSDVIIKIDLSTGKVVGKVDLSTLRAKTGIPEANQLTGEGPEVLNGIAYDSANNKIYITGKNWPKLLEVKLDN